MADNLRHRGIHLSNLLSNSPGVQPHNNGDINIILLGKTGVGKSSSGNTILGENKFKFKKSLKSVTKSCQREEAVVEGRCVSVVDTPGIFDTELPEEELAKEIAWSVFLSAPAHAFLFVLTVDRFTEQEEEILKNIKLIFGEGVLKYLTVLFTNGEDIDPEEFKEEINEHKKLKQIIDSCQGRYHVFNNKALNNREQVNDLLRKIDSMIEQNGGGHYSNQMLEDALRFRREEEERKQREEEERQRAVVKHSSFLYCCEFAFKRYWQGFKEYFRVIARKMRQNRNNGYSGWW